MAAYAEVPVVNAHRRPHPCQILADLLTIQEHSGSAWPHPSPMSAMGPTTWRTPTCSVGPLPVHGIGTPTAYQPKPEILARAQQIAAEQGGSITITDDLIAAVPVRTWSRPTPGCR